MEKWKSQAAILSSKNRCIVAVSFVQTGRRRLCGTAEQAGNITNPLFSLTASPITANIKVGLISENLFGRFRVGRGAASKMGETEYAEDKNSLYVRACVPVG